MGWLIEEREDGVRDRDLGGGSTGSEGSMANFCASGEDVDPGTMELKSEMSRVVGKDAPAVAGTVADDDIVCEERD